MEWPDGKRLSVLNITLNFIFLFFPPFSHWLNDVGESTDFENWKEKYLAGTLTKSYAEVNTQKGESNSRAALMGIRASVQRYILDPPINATFKIISGSEFKKANNVLAGRVKEL